MMLDFAILAQQCATSVDYPVAHAIVQQESNFNPYAINVNRAAQIKAPRSYNEAVSAAKKLIASGYNIDMGLGQINRSNLKWLNLSVEQVFDPCTNLKAMQTVYLNCYNTQAVNDGLGDRMQRAFSCYNTGNSQRGFFNGYVNKVTTHFNNFLAKNTSAHTTQFIDINRKSLPTNREDLAIYAARLNGDLGGEPVLTTSVNNEENITQQVVGEEKQIQSAAWDIFKDF